MASSNTSLSAKSEFLVNGKYRLIRKIGSGSFGDIYLGINVSNGEVWQTGLALCRILAGGGIRVRFGVSARVSQVFRLALVG